MRGKTTAENGVGKVYSKRIGASCPGGDFDIIILASPTMHGEELKYVTEAYETNRCWTRNRIDRLESGLHFLL